MEKTCVKITSTQIIDGEIMKSIYDAECLPLEDDFSSLAITYFDENKTLVTMKLYFYNDTECTINIVKPDYQTLINLDLKEKTKGTLVMNGLKMDLEFVLKKFFKKVLDISFEYDIFTSGKMVSTNIVEIEVKKC